MTKDANKQSPWANSTDKPTSQATQDAAKTAPPIQPSKPSPWGQNIAIADVNSIPSPPSLSLDDQKAIWVREEAQHILDFISSARHATLQHTVNNIIPRFPNQPFGLQLMSHFASHYDAIEAGVLDLLEGGDLDQIMYDVLGLTPDTQDRLTFVTEERDQLVEQECAKEASTDEISFKMAILKQITSLNSAYGTSLAMDDCYGDVAENVISTVDQALRNRLDSKMTMAFQIDPAQSVAH